MAKYKNTNGEIIDVSDDQAKAFQGGIPGLAKSGYTPFTEPASTATPTPPTTPPTPTPTPAASTDFATRYADYKKTNGDTTDYVGEENTARKNEADRLANMRMVIQNNANAQRAATAKLGEQRTQGTRAGLGINQGMNWTSTGEDQLYKISADTLEEQNKIDNAMNTALATADTDSLDRVSKTLDDLRKRRSDNEKTLISNFNDIVGKEMAQKQEDRLSKGQTLSDSNSQRDDARSVLDKILNTYSGQDLKNLPGDIKDSISALEASAGYPKGFIDQGLKSLKEQAAEKKTQEAPKTMVVNKQLLEYVDGKWQLAKIGGQNPGTKPTTPVTPKPTPADVAKKKAQAITELQDDIDKGATLSQLYSAYPEFSPSVIQSYVKNR